jgi:hypothetical protein
MSLKPFTNPGRLLLAVFLLAAPLLTAAPNGTMGNPDFTKGDPIPAGADHDWNLGATGARGWMFTDKMVTTDARQISVTKVDAGSPSEGALMVGDVILGVGGKPFSYDPRTEFGKALTAAEAGDGNLSLIRWRAGKEETVAVKLPVLGSYSATAPHDCPKSKLILEKGAEALAKSIASGAGRKQNPIPRALNALGLLATGDAKYLPLVKEEAAWASHFTTDAMATWYYGYLMLLVSEYTMATGDESFLPGLRRIAMEAAKGQSAVGSWGHKFAEPSGRLEGYGMMNSPGVVLTTALALAREAGVKDPEVAMAIERSAKLLRFYSGKGAIPYGDHVEWIQTHEDNGKCGMAAVLFSQLGETEHAEFFSRMSVASHGNERDTGHTGNFFNLTWAMPAVALSGPQATGAWMGEFGAWYYDLARRWDGTFAHLGPPQMKGDSYRNWDATGAYLIAYAMPLKHIRLTGKTPSGIPQLDADQAQTLILDGRGWTNKDRNSAYDALTPDQLLESLASWSPIVRERAAQALARRKDVPVVFLVKMLSSPEPNARYGACQTLAYLKYAATVPSLTALLDHEDMWLRVKAAQALAAIGQPAMHTLPKLLELLAKGSSATDPRGMEQRYLCFAVFGTMLKKSLEGVDRDLLAKAVAAGLRNQDGRARGAIGGVYGQLSYEEIKPLLPAIHEAIVTPAPSGEMFAAGIRLSGLELFAKHRIREGIPLCIDVMEIDKWGKKDRIGKCLQILGIYGPAAKTELPRLRQLEKDLTTHPEAKNLAPHTETLRKLIAKLEQGGEPGELRSLRD